MLGTDIPKDPHILKRAPKPKADDDARLRAADGALDDGALDALRRAASGTPGDDPYVSVFFFSDFGGLDLGRMPA